ncbi:hypothetical protein NL676_034832 [Syzygium grande]|nr:hypothetical protein NL676_034832 [Syzygium grande]
MPPFARPFVLDQSVSPSLLAPGFLCSSRHALSGLVAGRPLLLHHPASPRLRGSPSPGQSSRHCRKRPGSEAFSGCARGFAVRLCVDSAPTSRYPSPPCLPQKPSSHPFSSPLTLYRRLSLSPFAPPVPLAGSFRTATVLFGSDPPTA